MLVQLTTFYTYFETNYLNDNLTAKLLLQMACTDSNLLPGENSKIINSEHNNMKIDDNQ